MDSSGILGQIILTKQGEIKNSTGSLNNPQLIPYILTIVQSTAKILEQQTLNRITINYKESDIIIYVDQQDTVVLERKK